MKPNGLNENGTRKYRWAFTETKIPGIVANAKDKRIAAHAFRRFRLIQLRSLTPPVPPDLIRFWMGHGDKEIGDGYSKLKERVEFRRKIAAEVGLGFKLPAPLTGTNLLAMPKEKIA
jgi:hypothetical protein